MAVLHRNAIARGLDDLLSSALKKTPIVRRAAGGNPGFVARFWRTYMRGRRGPS
jgi:hypothetical protein